MKDLICHEPVRGFGPRPLIAWAKFTQNGSTNAAQTLTEQFGITSITKTGTGLWTVQLTERPQAFIPEFMVLAPNAEFHICRVISYSVANGTIALGHVYAATYSAVASAAADDGASLEFNVRVYSRGSL